MINTGKKLNYNIFHNNKCTNLNKYHLLCFLGFRVTVGGFASTFNTGNTNGNISRFFGFKLLNHLLAHSVFVGPLWVNRINPSLIQVNKEYDVYNGDITGKPVKR